MQEHKVTVGGLSHKLSEPFFVLATQNPIEQEGTYPLPEAQLDRFMFMVAVGYPSAAEELAIMKATTGGGSVQRLVTSCVTGMIRPPGAVRAKAFHVQPPDQPVFPAVQRK